MGEYFGTDDGRDADRAAIGRLMNGWMHRDLGEWDALAELFHPDATIDISWIAGPVSEFIAGSQRMAATPVHSKHFIGAPVITFGGDRAFVETSAAIHMVHDGLKLGVTQHNRFLDRVSKVDGQWRINHRDSSYDMGWFTYPFGERLADPIRPELFEGLPPEYAPMAYLNVRDGHPLQRPCATRGSELERAIKQRGADWVTGR